jgi:hypothetical protein
VIEINRHVTARAGIPTRATVEVANRSKATWSQASTATLLHSFRGFRKLPSAKLEVLNDSLGNRKAALLGECLAETGDLHFLKREGNVDCSEVQSAMIAALARRGVTREGPRHSIGESLGKQGSGAVHGAGFAIGHGLGFRIQQLAIDHLCQHQHVVAGRVFAENLALEPSQCRSQ